MIGECCEGEWLQVLDDMGLCYCGYWNQEFNHHVFDLCEMCYDMGGPCSKERVVDE